MTRGERDERSFALAVGCGLMAAALVIVIGVAVTVGSADRAAAEHSAPAPSANSGERVCFPRADWNGGNVPPSVRPCAEVRRVYEDGSLRIIVSDASGVVRYSRGIGVPNAYERLQP